MDWTNLITAVLTAIAVLVFQWGVSRLRKPRLRFTYQAKAPFVRDTPERVREPAGSKERTYQARYTNFGVLNLGYECAKNVQVLITGLARKSEHGIEFETNWLSLPLRWVLDEVSAQARGAPTEARDLMAEHKRNRMDLPPRYMVNLAIVSEAHPDRFRLDTLQAPLGQKVMFYKGTYFVRVTAYCQNGGWTEGWFRIWFGGRYQLLGGFDVTYLGESLQSETSFEADGPQEFLERAEEKWSARLGVSTRD